MEKAIVASTTSHYEMKRLIDDFKITNHILKEARDNINNGFKELSKDQDDLATKNGRCDIDISEILKINAGGIIISVTRDTLTHIKGTRLEDIFGGRWEKRLLRDRDGRIFLEVNPACFQAVEDYLNKRKIASTGSTPGKPRVGREDNIVLQQLLLAFGLGDDRLVLYNKSVNDLKVGEKKARGNVHSRASQDKWQAMNFKTFPTWKPYDI